MNDAMSGDTNAAVESRQRTATRVAVRISIFIREFPGLSRSGPHLS